MNELNTQMEELQNPDFNKASKASLNNFIAEQLYKKRENEIFILEKFLKFLKINKK